MPDQDCHSLLSYIPFLGLIAKDPKIQSPVSVRLVETAIMSVVAGGFAMYISVEVIKTEMTSLKESIHKVDVKVDQVDNKIERVRSDLYVPRGANK